MNIDNERALFESWFANKYGNEPGIFNHDEELDDYYRMDIRTHWQAWQARAELAPSCCDCGAALAINEMHYYATESGTDSCNACEGEYMKKMEQAKY